MFSQMLYGPDLPTWALFAEMALAGAVVIVAGSRFTCLADTLADRLNLGGGWIGLILLATVTSLPELVSGGTATAIGNVDLAVGAIFGSCCFNITLIFLLNAMRKGGSVLHGVHAAHSLSSSSGLALIAIALLGMVVVEKFSASLVVAQRCELAWAGIIVVAYLGCMRLIYSFERSQRAVQKEHSETPRERVGPGLYVPLALTALIIVAASWWLAQIGDVLSTHEIELIGRPLGATFVGACFLALATSLPEIVTSVAAVRLGNLDLALGNIFGSNMFNIFVIPVLKVVSVAKGDQLLLATDAVNSTQNVITGLLAILLSAIAVGGLAYQGRLRTIRRYGIDSLLILATYIGGMILLLSGPQP